MISLFKSIIKYLILLIILVTVFGAGFMFGKEQVMCPVCKPEQVDFSLFWDAYSKLHANYINPDKIDDQKIIYGAISGMTKSLGDPNTVFFEPSEAKMFQQELSGSFEGIGVELGIKRGILTIIAPLKDTPGERAGLKSGDQIIKINNENALDMSIEEAVSIIRGKRGTKITLTIYREGWKDTKDFEIIRDKIKVNSMSWEIRDENIAYIQIHQFDQMLPVDFRVSAFEILKSPAKSIVLDLRDNPGGYLDVSQDIAGWFIKPGEIVTIEDFGKDEEQNIFKANGNAALSELPIVVLINEGSASASEILAGALRDNRNIKLVGEKSFGKGSVQEAISLSDGESLIKITIAKWLTPKGNSISEIGLTPDIKVEITDSDIDKGVDPQLEKALEIIKGLK